MQSLEETKEEDLRESFSCWLSGEFQAQYTGLRFRRILCFEPLGRGQPPELVGDIYRALVPVLGRDPSIRSVAMPILAAGNQYWPVDQMLPPLLDATIHWLESGLPLEVVRIVAHSKTDAEEGQFIFELAAELSPPATEDSDKQLAREEEKSDSYEEVEPTEDKNEYDVFISYAHENSEEMKTLEWELHQMSPDIRIFLDRKNIDIGSAWQPEIFESLDRCRKVVPLFSPAYLESKVCKEEFNIAWVRSRETEQEVLFPLYLFSAKLPTYMKYRLYLDCREGDSGKIHDASRQLLKLLGPLTDADPDAEETGL